MKYIKVIKKWASLRHSDKKFADTAIALYEQSNETDKKLMLKEFQDYIDAVKSGSIEASPIELPMPRPVRTEEDIKNEKQLKDYYQGN